MKYYKCLTKDGRGPFSGYPWNLPTEDGPGEWMPHIEKLEQCKSGYHVCRRKDVVHWLSATIYEFEGRGEHEEYSDKVAFQGGRLVRKLDLNRDKIVRFAKACANRAKEHAAAAYAATAAAYAATAAAYAATANAAAAAANAAAAAANAAAERQWQTEYLFGLMEEGDELDEREMR